MNTSILITIPTLGQRLSSLKFTLASIQEFAPNAEIEIRTPDMSLESKISQFLSTGTRIVIDSSNQATSILNSWNSNRSSWYTWINDDDFALDGFKSTELLMSQLSDQSRPVVIYGDLVVMTPRETLRIKTPKKISKWLLSSGSDYVPGILTLMNAKSVKTISELSEKNGLLKNSFDYQWWLQLASKNAIFKHTGSCHAAWRDHPEARTNIEVEFSGLETTTLKNQYLKSFQRNSFIKVINSLLAKIVARILSLEIW